jgi:AraC-like DNA-binding protein
MKLYIKNMVTESCKIVVKNVVNKLGISPVKVDLGEIETKQDLPDNTINQLKCNLRKAGLELLESRRDVLVEKIKKVMIDYVYHSDNKPHFNFSIKLSKELGHSYNYLANIFSEVENTTIGHYIIALRIERAKEMIIFGDDNISEIANKLNYSSVAHLSAQFKKITGMSPSEFKASKEKTRIPIQNLTTYVHNQHSQQVNHKTEN